MTPPGMHRQWRWFRTRGSDRSVAKDEFQALPVDAQAALVDVMKRYSRGATLRDEVKALSKGLMELRVNLGSNHFRLVSSRIRRCTTSS